jgi:hypothetical protein
MSEEQHAAFMQHLSETPAETWRGTDGTLYLAWMPSNMSPPVGMVDSRVALPPGDPNYGRFLDDLLPHYDYQGMEIPDAPSPDDDTEA